MVNTDNWPSFDGLGDCVKHMSLEGSAQEVVTTPAKVVFYGTRTYPDLSLVPPKPGLPK